MKYVSKIAGTLITVAALSAHATAQDLTVSAGAEYTSGDYGGSGDTEVFYVPFSLGIETDGWFARVSLPYLNISGPGIFLGEDIPIARDRDAPNRAMNESVSGFGDLSLTVGRGFALDETGDWNLDVTGRVKFATADSDTGLSTGQMDYSFALDLTRDIGAWSWFTGGGYRVTGDPVGRELNNTVFASFGAARYNTKGGSWGFAYDFSQAVTTGTDDAHELSSWLGFRLTDSARLQVYGIKGLTDGGPNYGGGLRLSLRL